MNKNLISLIFVLILFSNTKCEREEVIVEISQGSLRGLKLNSVLGIPYYSFRGIPYATPPLGKLRFKAPQTPLRWNGTRDATIEGAACIQPIIKYHYDEKYNESCLFINVFTPNIEIQNENELLPVMVWVHGGGFIRGSGNSLTYGPDFFLSEDVVLVTFNYRLGVLGFLNMEVKDCQGNAGLKDQVAALRWVAKEISKFGGDPNSITIFGQDSGAASVNHLYLSPLTKDLFHRAISQSGSSLTNLAYKESSYEYGVKLAEILGCPTSDANTIVSCLKDADINDLAIEQLNSRILLDKYQSLGGPFVPSLEKNLGEDMFLPMSPFDLIKNCCYKDVPYIFGFNNKEGGCLIKEFLVNNFNPRNDLKYILPHGILETNTQETIDRIVKKLKGFYFGKESQNTSNELDSLTNFLTDRFFSYDIIRTVHLLDSENVYLYYFQYEGNYVYKGNLCKEYNITGVCHGGELGYLFYSNYTTEGHDNLVIGSKDMVMLQRMVRLWTNFAKEGKPANNIKDPLLPVLWEPITKYLHQYLDINIELNMTYDNLLQSSAFLWDRLRHNPASFEVDLVSYNDDKVREIETGYFIVGVFEVFLVILFIILMKYVDAFHREKRYHYELI